MNCKENCILKWFYLTPLIDVSSHSINLMQSKVKATKYYPFHGIFLVFFLLSVSDSIFVSCTMAVQEFYQHTLSNPKSKRKEEGSAQCINTATITVLKCFVYICVKQ